MLQARFYEGFEGGKVHSFSQPENLTFSCLATSYSRCSRHKQLPQIPGPLQLTCFHLQTHPFLI